MKSGHQTSSCVSLEYPSKSESDIALGSSVFVDILLAEEEASIYVETSVTSSMDLLWSDCFENSKFSNPGLDEMGVI